MHTNIHNDEVVGACTVVYVYIIHTYGWSNNGKKCYGDLSDNQGQHRTIHTDAFPINSFPTWTDT